MPMPATVNVCHIGILLGKSQHLIEQSGCIVAQDNCVVFLDNNCCCTTTTGSMNLSTTTTSTTTTRPQGVRSYHAAVRPRGFGEFSIV